MIFSIFADLSKMTWGQNKSTNERALYPDHDVKKSPPLWKEGEKAQAKRVKFWRSSSEPVILSFFADLSKMTWRQNKSANERALYPDHDVKKSSPSEKREKKHTLNAWSFEDLTLS